jgi:DNA-binding MarR family transcriptional regulator
MEQSLDIEGIVISPETVDLDVLDDTLSFYLRSLNVAVSRDWESRLDGLEMIKGTGKVTALFLIGGHPGIWASVIARIAMKDRSEMGRLLDGLARHGLIERRRDAADSRARGLFLTEEGERVVAELRGRVRASRAYFSDVTADDYDKLLTMLRKIYWRIVSEPQIKREKLG